MGGEKNDSTQNMKGNFASYKLEITKIHFAILQLFLPLFVLLCLCHAEN